MLLHGSTGNAHRITEILLQCQEKAALLKYASVLDFTLRSIHFTRTLIGINGFQLIYLKSSQMSMDFMLISVGFTLSPIGFQLISTRFLLVLLGTQLHFNGFKFDFHFRLPSGSPRMMGNDGVLGHEC